MDWFSKYADRINLVEDAKGLGKADRATVFADGFNAPLDGLAAGVLAWDDRVYFTCIPNLWVLRDTKRKGQADEKQSLLQGFGVQCAYLGHDLHGLAVGPDGKMYFSVGDRGAHVVSKENKTYAGPRNGAVFRCDMDGSNFEVVHTGLRNPQELAFDQFGNLFADDNNCDKGDHARLVYVVEGGHSGWNMAYQTIDPPQWGKDYVGGPWFAEKLWHLAHPGQPAYILPAVGRIGAGPSGFAFTSGLTLPERYRNSFFMANFTGSGGIDAFRVVPKGATFEIADYHGFLTQYGLVTDVDFGPDGKMYFSDWVQFTWDGGGVGKGRIYTVHAPKAIADPAVAEVKKLLAEGLRSKSDAELTALLAHADQRIRLRAQFALAERGAKAIPVFDRVARESKNVLARLHALWGLGQIARREPAAVDAILSRLEDGEAEVRAQSAKLLGETTPSAPDHLIARLKDAHPRVRFFAAQSLGKLKHRSAVEPILAMLRENKDQDAYLRHAGVYALHRIGELDAVAAKSEDAEPAVRMAVLLTLRHSADRRIAKFLNDAEDRIVVEAARAIHDLPIDAALPELAAWTDRLLGAKPISDLALWRRALDARFRLGRPEDAVAVVRMLAHASTPSAVREEAIRAVAEWTQPDPRDRVIGYWRPIAKRDSAGIEKLIEANLAGILASAPAELQPQVAKLVGTLKLNVDDETFVGWALDRKRTPEVRSESLRLLASRNAKKLTETTQTMLVDGDPNVRSTARDVLAERDPAEGIKHLAAVLDSATTREKQAALVSLKRIPQASSLPVLGQAIETWNQGKLERELQLDVFRAATTWADGRIAAKLPVAKNDSAGAFKLTLHGGDAARGRAIFQSHGAAQCIRCHRVQGSGGDAGPDLSKWAPKGTREHFLESLLEPDRKITPSYGVASVTLDDGRTFVGAVIEESKTTLKLVTGDGKAHRIALASIESRSAPKSQMPAMGAILTLEEIRDVIEFLATLKQE
ncbi:MAG: PVC-type heme-binding CxxCH protein [Gemmataceae bacterium]